MKVVGQLPWNGIDISNVTPLEKACFPFPIRYQWKLLLDYKCALVSTPCFQYGISPAADLYGSGTCCHISVRSYKL